MVRAENRQIALKPQDLVVVVKLTLWQSRPFAYGAMAEELGMSASEVHACLQRALTARLVMKSSEVRGVAPIRRAVQEFVLHGAKYAFPPVLGSVTRGMPTAYGGPALREALTESVEGSPVWPYPDGPARGTALYPLYPSVPKAALVDPALYEFLSLIDALRMGAARERELAEELIVKRLR